MRSLPAFSDSSTSLNFLLTIPAKNPRTECCCQPVAFMIAAMVAPLACRSIERTVSCFDEDLASLALDSWFALPDGLCDVDALRFGGADFFLVGLGFLVVVIGRSPSIKTASLAATDASPAKRQ